MTEITSDVLVVGGGVTGVAAATAAARSGLKVVLLESRSFVGGNATSGLCLHNFITKSGTQVVFGLAQELVDRLKKVGGAVGHIPYSGFVSAVTPVDGNLFRIVATELLAEAGVETIYGVQVVGTAVSDGHIDGLQVAMKGGVSTVRARHYVDCTGDADIAVAAGAPYRKGDEHTGKYQPISMIMHFYGVDTRRIAEDLSEHEPAIATRQDHPEPFPVYFNGTLSKWNEPLLSEQIVPNKDHKIFFNTVWPNQINVNTSAVPHLDPTNPLELSRATIELTKQCGRLGAFLRDYVPGFEGGYFEPAIFAGVRESRNIKGIYELCEDDVLSGRKFTDSIGKVCFPIDIHDPDTGQARFQDIGGDGAFDIPYRALLPQYIENLLVAGRCISATHQAHGSTRNMAPCLVTGEAAGIAAALCASSHSRSQDLDIDSLQTELVKRGVYLDHS